MRQSTIVRGIVALAALGVATWGGTVTYLEHFDHAGAPKIPAGSVTLHDPVSMAAFSAFQEVRCDYCHAKGADLPFYFKLPVANQIMSHDLTEGRLHFNFAPIIADFQQGKPPSIEQLSRIEEVISQNRMPPAVYLTMHPHAYLNEKQRNDILTWVRVQRERYYASADVAPNFRGEVIQPLPEVAKVDWKKAALGRTLYFDKHLSGDGTLNCASCHGLDKGGVDNLVTSTGIRQQKGPINAPSVYNSSYNLSQFWDGRAKDLAAQAAGPVTNPKEMGAHDWDEAAAHVREEPGMAEQFEAIYGPNSINKNNVTDAIAEYEKTLITPNSRFDQYLKGSADAITAQEKRGYERFKQIGCSGCHSGVAMGGGAYEVMGLEGPYFADRHTAVTDADAGRIGVTQKQDDEHRFKVPNLRNVALTGPWFHDGSAKTLEEAVRLMAKYQTPDHNISDQDVNDITAFLKTLTGKYQGVSVDHVEAEPELKVPEQAAN